MLPSVLSFSVDPRLAIVEGRRLVYSVVGVDLEKEGEHVFFLLHFEWFLLHFEWQKT